MTDHYTLITNLNHVIVNGVHTYTHALLIEQKEDRCQLQGFCTDAALPIFCVRLPTAGFVLRDPQGDLVNFVTLSQYSVAGSRLDLEIAGAPSVELWTSRGSCHPIDVCRFDAAEDLEDIEGVLRRKVAQYWSAPCIPIAHYVPVDTIRGQETKGN